MKNKIIVLLLIAVGLFFVYSFVSCGTDYYLDLNLVCPISLNQRSLVVSPSSSVIGSGTYFIYSINKAVSEPDGKWKNILIAYHLESGTTKEILSKDHPFSFEIKGNKILATDGILNISGPHLIVGLDGKQTPIKPSDNELGNLVESKNGQQKFLVAAFNNDTKDFSCPKDGLKIQMFNTDGSTTEKVFSWKDYGLNQLCPENYYLSNDGKYFYVTGDLMGSGSTDTLMKYSIDEDKMTKIEVGKNSWLGSWQLDADNGWFVGVTLGYNLEPKEIVRINLFSGEVTTLTEQNSNNIYQVFLSPDGNYWSPVFSDGIEGVSSCVRILPVGEKMANNDSQCLLGGKVIRWVDNLLVVNRDGELTLYDIKKQKVILLFDTQNSQVISADNYVGTVKIE